MIISRIIGKYVTEFSTNVYCNIESLIDVNSSIEKAIANKDSATKSRIKAKSTRFMSSSDITNKIPSLHLVSKISYSVQESDKLFQKQGELSRKNRIRCNIREQFQWAKFPWKGFQWRNFQCNLFRSGKLDWNIYNIVYGESKEIHWRSRSGISSTVFDRNSDRWKNMETHSLSEECHEGIFFDFLADDAHFTSLTSFSRS